MTTKRVAAIVATVALSARVALIHVGPIIAMPRIKF